MAQAASDFDADPSANQPSTLQGILDSLKGREIHRAELQRMTEEVAARLLSLSDSLTMREDRSRAGMLARLMRDEAGQEFSTALTDRIFRSQSGSRQVEQVQHLLRRFGTPRSRNLFERMELNSLFVVGPLAPQVVARAVMRKVREETEHVLLPAEPDALRTLLEQRHARGHLVNVNRLGEALLGEQEAQRRVRQYVEIAQRNDVDALSVKVSSISSQIDLLAFDHSLETLAGRLAQIYKASLRDTGTGPIVMLDMEAYHDLELTFALLQRVLERSDMLKVRAGIVLQAYLPDSHALQRELIHWSSARVARGGQPVRLRIVKGANLAQERVDSSLAGYPLPIYNRKEEVDASYRRMVLRAAEAESQRAVQVGLASHNLFDIAMGLVLRAQHDLGHGLQIELLEGMATPLQRALRSLRVPVLMYAPIVDEGELNSGIAYLVRRLDENTSEENFLRSSFEMQLGTRSWERERSRFRAGFSLVDSVGEEPSRAGHPAHARDRRTEHNGTHAPDRSFFNAPDTDFSRVANRIWIHEALQRRQEAAAPTTGSLIAGRECRTGDAVDAFDPSRPGAVPYRYHLCDAAEIEQALQLGQAPMDDWPKRSPADRAKVLMTIARGLDAARAELTAWMVTDAGKAVREADGEISETVDFARYYGNLELCWRAEPRLRSTPLGTVLVTPPWNFPLAIPAGGALAALMAGNRVLLKPALESVMVARKLCEICWQAGVPTSALQLVLCRDSLASRLVRDERVDAVILTGATQTAQMFQQLRPGLHLMAETGGKNSILVSAMADREAAIHDAVRSAFAHAGQKCSAASLLICEAEVYDDPNFLRTLSDATRSLHVGSAWDPRSIVTPLIRTPTGALARALERMEGEEEWLVRPEISPDNPRLLSPGIKLGVRPGGLMHRTELFGPMLAVMRASDLGEALGFVEQTGFGLTAGIHSLDEREQQTFIDRSSAGNLYVNRGITGAIVQRQPFGGMGLSGFGPGAKAGGPGYVAQLCRYSEDPEKPPPFEPPKSWSAPDFVECWRPRLDPQRYARLLERARTWLVLMEQRFAPPTDSAQIHGESNVLRYLPCPDMLLRVALNADLLDLASCCIASRITRARPLISTAPGVHVGIDSSLTGLPMQEEDCQTLLQRRSHQHLERIRVLGELEAGTLRLAVNTGAHLCRERPIGHGRVELPRFLREQAISVRHARHGRVARSLHTGGGSVEATAPPAHLTSDNR